VRVRRSALLALPVAAAGAVGAIVLTGGDGGGGAGGGAQAAAGSAGATVAVSRRTLVDRQRVDGTLGYAGTRSATNRLSGTITWLPHTGQVIRPGQVLFRVDGEPVVLMNGTLPAYRTLKTGIDDGGDVRQLERGLRALGYDPGTVDRTYTATTAAAVRAWQDDHGLEETGEVELGRVAFLPGARRVSAVKAAVGSAAKAPGGDDTGDRTEFAAYHPVDPLAKAKAKALAKAKAKARAKARAKGKARAKAKADAAAKARAQKPAGKPTTPTTAKTPATSSGGADGDGSPADGDGGDGGGSTPAVEVLSTTSTRRVVTAEVDAADQELAVEGRRVRVELPDGRTVSGRITDVGTVATAADDGSGGGDPGEGDSTPTITVTIRLTSARAAGRLDQAPVSVQLARTTRRGVLAVPVQALVAQPGGGYAVERADGRLVDVEPGLFANGYVELTGGRIAAGDRVRVPE
jgi:peptidoglycan hydrolase-like protein with peptidoglycan-binding domain